jgi:H+/Cl- antiporter ClcA
LFFITVLIGIISGLGGMFLDLFLHFIQHVAYEHRLTPLIVHETFLNEVSASTPLNRVMILLLCGFVAGFGWWAVFRYGQPLVSIPHAVKSNKPYMPMWTTIAHVLLQIGTVALGSPLGREVAPRELGAVLACWITNAFKLKPKECQILVACAAGAGLAAVYNVPFGGALFTLEVLLGSFHWFAVVPAIITSAIAVVVSWIGLGNQSMYHIPSLSLDYSIVIWSILFGPLFGLVAYWFKEATLKSLSYVTHDWKIIPACLINFFLIGLLAIYLPEVLGNGRSAAQLGFDGSALSLGVVTLVFFLRMVTVCTSVRAGASGGLLTPSLANGALMAVILGILWNSIWPSVTILSAFAVIGSAAFLAAAQNMPLTAIVLVIEFTGINFSFFIPILFAVAGSMSVFHLCTLQKSI